MRGVLKDSIGRPTIHSLRTRLSEMREGELPGDPRKQGQGVLKLPGKKRK